MEQPREKYGEYIEKEGGRIHRLMVNHLKKLNEWIKDDLNHLDDTVSVKQVPNDLSELTRLKNRALWLQGRFSHLRDERENIVIRSKKLIDLQEYEMQKFLEMTACLMAQCREYHNYNSVVSEYTEKSTLNDSVNLRSVEKTTVRPTRYYYFDLDDSDTETTNCVNFCKLFNFK